MPGPPYSLFGQLYYELPFDLLNFTFFPIFLIAPQELHSSEDFFLPQLAALCVVTRGLGSEILFGNTMYSYSEILVVCVNMGSANFYSLGCSF